MSQMVFVYHTVLKISALHRQSAQLNHLGKACLDADAHHMSPGQVP